MKKIIATLTILLACHAVNAQGDHQPFRIDSELLTNISLILFFILLGVFILAIMKLIFEHRVKNKLLDKGAPEDLVSQILQPVKKDSRDAIIKWFAILAGVGIGLFLVDYFQPLGIHSLAIMSLSLSASFLGYYFFTGRPDKRE
jgi:hypothetical protein